RRLDSQLMPPSMPMVFTDSSLDRLLHRSGFGIARVGRAMRFDQQQMNFLFGNRAMLDTFRHHIEIAGTKPHIAIAQLDREMTFEHKEEVVGIGVRMPDELTLRFH